MKGTQDSKYNLTTRLNRDFDETSYTLLSNCGCWFRKLGIMYFSCLVPYFVLQNGTSRWLCHKIYGLWLVKYMCVNIDSF